MRKYILIILVIVMMGGCGPTNGLLGTNDPRSVAPAIETGLTPSEVIKLYFSLTGYGKYVIAYELLTDEEKRQTTLKDIQSITEQGKVKLESVISEQAQGELSLVTAVIRYTDDKSNQVHYEMRDFILKKQEGEWRIIDQSLLKEHQLEDLATLLKQKAGNLKNNESFQRFLSGMEQQNREWAKKVRAELEEQSQNLQSEWSNTIRENGNGLMQQMKKFKSGLPLPQEAQ